MKRTVFKLCVFLLLGVVVNVAVAWGIARFVKPHRLVKHDAATGAGPFVTSGFELIAPGLRRSMHIKVGSDLQFETAWTHEAGWPMLSLQRSHAVSPNQIAVPREYRLFVPICPGFAIDTGFYAAICWLSFAARHAWRRRRRIKRGLCPACAYPTGASDRCTECGAPVKPKAAEVQA